MKITKKLFLIMFGIIAINGIFPTKASAASSVETESHFSTVLNRKMYYNVYLPPSYATDTTKKYPVMYLLHGMSGSYTDWKNNGMQSIVDSTGGREMVIIMPNGLDSFYIDGYKSGIKYESYMYQEFIPMVESKYRIDAADGKNRAIAGLSMGGFGAAYHGFKYPEKFSSVYAMSGAFEFTGNIYAVINKDKYPAFTMECGTEDLVVIQSNVNLHNKLLKEGITHDYITRNGLHSWSFWKKCLPKAIKFAESHFETE